MHGVYKLGKFGKSQEDQKSVRKFVNSQEIYQIFQKILGKPKNELREKVSSA